MGILPGGDGNGSFLILPLDTFDERGERKDFSWMDRMREGISLFPCSPS